MEPGRGWWGYRPLLDGLRAVAVYLVVLFHAGAGRFSGGFVGVDVFFVLSGFLVTRLLLRDLVGSGRVGFGRFYARRFRRLLPAAFVVLVVTAVVFAALASPVEVVEAAGGFKAAFLYVTNWYFIAQSADYFGADLATNPVLHFWSLAVEEQFYLVWPLLLGGLFVVAGRFGARQWRVVRAAGAGRRRGVVGVGVVAADVGPGPGLLRDRRPGLPAPRRRLVGPDPRGRSPGRPHSRGRAARWRWRAWSGLVVVASSLGRRSDPIERGMAATVVTVVVLVALEAATAGLPRAGAVAGAVVYLGKISYGTYLWHWPVIWSSPAPSTSPPSPPSPSRS